MAIKIDLEKVVGSDSSEETPSHSLLRQVASSGKASWETWQTRIPRPLRTPQALVSFIIFALFIQAFICWRIFFPPGPEYATSPPYNANETVSLITEYYHLLQDLRYVGRDSIAYPPHTGTHAINLTLCHTLGLSPSAIETLQQLPYIIPHEDQLNNTGGYLTGSELEHLHEQDGEWYPGWMTPSRDIFWRNGHFLDYRDDAQLLASRDPLQRWHIDFSESMSFHDAMIEYDALPKSAIPLSFIPGRKYGLSLVLDTADGRLVVLDTQSFGNTDPFIMNLDREHIPSQYRIRTTYYRNEVSARLGNEFWEELIVHTANLDGEYILGSVRTDRTYTPELSPPRWERWVRELYQHYGWPREKTLKGCRYAHFQGEENKCEQDPLEGFNGTGFDIAMKELRHKIEVQYMPDWYCPVPREQEIIDRLKWYGRLTEEQIKFAESDEPKVVEKLEGWARNLAFLQN